jgi:putative ATP-binding cassette transporter
VSLNAFGRGLSALLKPFAAAPGSGRDLARALALLVAVLANVYLMVLFNDWRNSFYTALQEYDGAVLARELAHFAALASISVALSVISYRLERILSLNWRKALTESYLARWLDGSCYYRIQLFGSSTDNPDQRISDDVNLFVSRGLEYAVGLLNASAMLVTFLVILWGLSGDLELEVLGVPLRLPGYMVWAAVLYAAAGTWITDRFGRCLVGLNFAQQRLEADFRFGMACVRQNAGPTALSSGAAAFEGKSLSGRLSGLLRNFRRIIDAEQTLVGIRSAYFQIADVFPVVISVPRYLARKINLGGLMQTAQAFGRVQQSLSWFVRFYAGLAEWIAAMERLTRLAGDIEAASATEAAPDAAPEAASDMAPEAATGFVPDKLAGAASVTAVRPARRSEGDALEARGLSAALPGGGRLFEGLDFRLGPGERALLVGPNGSGKSTLIRIAAGIWPFWAGALVVPREGETAFLPERPWLPVAPFGEALGTASPGVDLSLAERLVSGLDLEKVMKLAEEEGEADWPQKLSAGELQKAALFRALLLKPSWIFMDECLSSADADSEARALELIESEFPRAAVLYVSHRSTAGMVFGKRLDLSRYAARND